MADLLRSFLSQSQHTNVDDIGVTYRGSGETDGLDPACVTLNFIDAGTMVYLTPKTANALLVDLSRAMMEHDIATGKATPDD